MKCPYVVFGLLICSWLFGSWAVADEPSSVQRTPEEEKQLQEAVELNNQAYRLWKAGRPDKAIPLLEKILQIRRDILGADHPGYAESLNNLGMLYRGMADYEKAEPFLVRAMEIRERVLGKEHPDYVMSLNNLGMLYCDMSKYTEAEPLLSRALEIHQKISVPENPTHGLFLNNLAVLYDNVGEYEKAESFYLRALEIREKVLGEEHPDYAVTLNNLAVMYTNIGKYEKAERLYLRALEISEKAGGKEYPDYVQCLSNLGMFYQAVGDYHNAESRYEEAMTLAGKIWGENHPVYADSLNNLGVLYTYMGKYVEAESFHLRALEIRQKLGPEHRDYLTSLNNLGFLYQKLGEYGKAERFLLQATSGFEQILGELHPVCATSLSNLGTLYQDMGEYAKAEEYHLRALEVHERGGNERTPDYATCLNNLATLYQAEGEYAKAESLLREVMEIDEEILGKEHPEYATSLNNLAYLYQNMREYRKAELLYLQASEIRRNVFGESSLIYAASLNNLANLYQNMGENKYESAERYFLQALRIYKETWGEEHPVYALCLNNLACLYQDMGKYKEAEPLYLQVLATRKKVLGEEHPDYAASLSSLAFFYYSINDYEKTEAYYRDALDRKITLVDRVLPALSEARAIAFVEQQCFAPDFYLSALRRQKEIDPAKAYQAVWQTRAPVTRMLVQRRESVADLPETRDLLLQLHTTGRELAQLTLAVPESAQREARQRQLAGLSEEKEKLEAELGRMSTEFRQQKEVRDADIRDLAAKLDEKTVVVDIIMAILWEPPEKGKTIRAQRYYEAFVLRKSAAEPGYSVAWVHLGPADPIDEAIGRWRAELTGQGSGLSPASNASDQFLRKAIWEKIEPHLGGCSTVVILPDAQLNFLPWSALPGRRPGSYLIEDYAIATAGYGQQLYGILTDPYPTASDGVLLVGGVAYDQRPGSLPVDPADSASSDQLEPPRGRVPAVRGPLRWPPLPGTAAEVDAVGRLWKGSSTPVVLKDIQANEDQLRQAMPGNRYILLATHGFFADETFRFKARHDTENEQLFEDSDRDSIHNPRNSVTGRNPLLLSGIVAAGANQPPVTDSLGLPTGEDGILTAEEIAVLDLRGTDLVVLSACETGLGRFGIGEGVMGLGRAFHMAGARTVVASIWRVDDEATRELMTRFYYNLWEKKMGKLEAFREAQLSIMHGVRTSNTTRGVDFTRPEPLPKGPAEPRADPRFWAGFVLSGDWK